MAHIAVIIGVAGGERYLARPPQVEVTNEKEARRFRSPASAEAAAQDRIAREAPVVQRSMGYRVEERA